MQDRSQKADADKSRGKSNMQYLMQYTALGGQLLATIGIAVFLGIKADGYLKFQTPLLSWVLPLLVVAGMIIKVIKETNRK